MDRSQFLRLFSLRSKNLMWFLGAGASASAGIRTAAQMIWHFKQQIFCTDNRVSVKSCPPLGDGAFQSRLNRYFAEKSGFPRPGSAEEYSFYFEYAYASEQDRRTYLDAMVSGAMPTQGHYVLAALAKSKRLHVVWTTNFDKLIEDVFVRVLGSLSEFAVCTLDAPELADQALSDDIRPVIIKLHGDFLSRKLKNTSEELQSQDAKLRRSLINESKRKGLVVSGFSGRDGSIMEALEEGLDGGNGFPQGLFWVHRPDNPPAERVTQLLEKAQNLGIEAHLVEVETFDELLSDILLLFNDIPMEVQRMVAEGRKWLTPVSIPQACNDFPFIRMNAFPVLDVPATCRLLECSIGGTAEVRAAVGKAGVDILAARCRAGVIAFGSDASVRSAFDEYGITQFGLHAIDQSKLEYESSEQGLLSDALARGLVRDRPLRCLHARRGWKIFVDVDRVGEPILRTLSQAAKGLSGLVPKTSIRWAEAIRIRLERRLERNWLLVEPGVWVDQPDSDDDAEPENEEILPRAEDSAIADFIKERSATRYNHVLQRLLDGWTDVLIGVGEQEREIRALGIGDGVDAVFRLHRTTAFSGRITR